MKKAIKMTEKKGESVTREETTVAPQASDVVFPIIGIGASAGGLEAFELFFKSLPPDCGMAFVLIPHLDPGHASMLSEILQRNTTMRVHEVQDQTAIQINNVYVIPPNKDMAIVHGTLSLSVPERSRGMRLPIDSFFRSLADDQGERAICMILSGSGSDGTLGLRAIHGAGGVSFVQDPSTAKYDGMPSSAVQIGLATYVLPIEKLSEQLVNYVKTIVATGLPPNLPVSAATSGLKRIIVLLRSKTGNDFSHYKQSTVRRRIERRMAALGLAEVDAYAEYLQQNPAEVQILFKELLINVTSFFRDKEAFDSLARTALPKMLDDRPDNYVLRVWVPGCASGEEAYSIAMLIHEHMEANKRIFDFQIYATDIDEEAIAIARAGKYPANIALDVSPDRLRQFFAKDENGFRIKKEIRDHIIFAIQNVIKDPPFTRMDLISCRNLLIYLELELQTGVIPAFHYALRPEGVLLLGPSEGIGNFTDLFVPMDRKWKIYRSISTTNQLLVPQRFQWVSRNLATIPNGEEGKSEPDLAELTKRTLIQSFAPPSVIIDEKGDIKYVQGDAGKYLQPAQGHPSTKIIDMAREGLQRELGKTIQGAILQKKVLVKRDVPVKTNGGIHGVDIIVQPLADSKAARGLMLISFQDAGPRPQDGAKPTKGAAKKGDAKRMEDLEQDLNYTKESLQATIEEMQAANEELKSANEELQSTNEEFQSTNEELETSKEELQSVNEEIVTVNSELHQKIEQLTEVQNDLKNLLEGTNIGTVFLDERLNITRFTHDATQVFRLVSSDTGRPLADIRSLAPDVDLVSEAQAVLASLIPREMSIRTISNKWFLVRIMPYRTLENAIEGVVLTFSEVTALKDARDYAQSIVDGVIDPLIVLNGGLEVVSASRSFYQTFGVAPEDTEGRPLLQLSWQWNIPQLHQLLEKTLPKTHGFENIEIEHDFPQVGRKIVSLSARQISGGGTLELILLSLEDITERKQAESAYREANRRLNLLTSITRHDIVNQLLVLTGNISLLKKDNPPLASDKHLLHAEAAADWISVMVRFTKEYEEIGFGAPIWCSLPDLVDSGAASVEIGSVKLSNDIPKGMEVLVDPLISKVFHNLVDNAVKHGAPLTRIRFYVKERDGARSIVCEDDGVGINDKDRENLFERGFGKDHGLGLFLSREILAITGIVITESGQAGKGARFEMLVPPGAWRHHPVSVR